MEENEELPAVGQEKNICVEKEKMEIRQIH